MRVTLNQPTQSLNCGAEAQSPRIVPYQFTVLTVMALDMTLAILSFLGGDILFHRLVSGGAGSPMTAALLGATAGLVLVLFLVFVRGYSGVTLRNARSATVKFLQGWAIGFFVLGWAAFLTQTTGIASRGSISLAFAIGILAALPTRLSVLAFMTQLISDRRIATSEAILVHEDETTGLDGIRRDLARNGIDVRAAFPIPKDLSAETSDAFINACRAVIAERDIDAIHLFVRWNDASRIQSLRIFLAKLSVPVYLYPDRLAAEVVASRRLEVDFGTAFEVQSAPLDIFDRLQKRTFDIVASSALLVGLIPVFALVAIAIKWDSPGPVLFRQDRKGFSGRWFGIYKFRSMSVMENGSEVQQASRDDVRTTRVGRFLRRSSIDELPQLFNVLRGDMSLVGPRPHAVAHDDYYQAIISAYAVRHHVKPGLTGWAQVNGLRGATPCVSMMEARVTHDLWYIDNWSLWLDLRILLRTARVIRDPAAF